MTPRGFVSVRFDGGYKFSRYYAPNNFNTPTAFEALIRNSDHPHAERSGRPAPYTTEL